MMDCIEFGVFDLLVQLCLLPVSVEAPPLLHSHSLELFAPVTALGQLLCLLLTESNLTSDFAQSVLQVDNTDFSTLHLFKITLG